MDLQSYKTVNGTTKRNILGGGNVTIYTNRNIEHNRQSNFWHITARYVY